MITGGEYFIDEGFNFLTFEIIDIDDGSGIIVGSGKTDSCFRVERIGEIILQGSD